MRARAAGSLSTLHSITAARDVATSATLALVAAGWRGREGGGDGCARRLGRVRGIEVEATGRRGALRAAEGALPVGEAPRRESGAARLRAQTMDSYFAGSRA